MVKKIIEIGAEIFIWYKFVEIYFFACISDDSKKKNVEKKFLEKKLF